MIFERQKTNEVNPTIATANFLAGASRLRPRKGRYPSIPTVLWSGKQKSLELTGQNTREERAAQRENCRHLQMVHLEYSAKHSSAYACEEISRVWGEKTMQRIRRNIPVMQNWEEYLFSKARLENLIIQSIW